MLATGTDEDGLTVIVAEFERSSGIGSVAAAIPTDMFVPMTDHVVLAIFDRRLVTNAQFFSALLAAQPSAIGMRR